MHLKKKKNMVKCMIGMLVFNKINFGFICVVKIIFNPAHLENKPLNYFNFRYLT